MITVSLCMIVRDEEEVLARCLESVGEIADEIVIVDTGSTDATVEIARRFTPLVYHFPWVDDFAAARNFAFSKATKEYILWLDADDLLLPADQTAFLQLKQTLDPAVDMVMMPYHVGFSEDGQPVFFYERERLLRRETGFAWQGAVHEVISPRGKVLHAPIAVTHRKEKPADPARNLRIFEKLLENGAELEPRQQYYYARELAANGRDREAVRIFTRFLEDGGGWVEDCIGACLDLSGCYRRLGENRAAIESLGKSFVYGRPRAEVCCALGEIFLESGELWAAVDWYKTALRCDFPQSGGFCQPDYQDFVPCIQLCVCYDRLGERGKALFWHQRAKRLKPGHPSVRQNERYFYG